MSFAVNLQIIAAFASTDDGRKSLERWGHAHLIEHPERCTDRAAADLVRKIAASEMGRQGGKAKSAAKSAASAANIRGRRRRSKLSDDQVAAIRASTASHSELAREYGVVPNTIRRARGL